MATNSDVQVGNFVIKIYFGLWLIDELYLNIQQKVQDELYHVFGSSTDRLITQGELVNLNYLECCIKESLRLYPTVPFIERFAKEDIQVGKI